MKNPENVDYISVCQKCSKITRHHAIGGDKGFVKLACYICGFESQHRRKPKETK